MTNSPEVVSAVAPAASSPPVGKKSLGVSFILSFFNSACRLATHTTHTAETERARHRTIRFAIANARDVLTKLPDAREALEHLAANVRDGETREARMRVLLARFVRLGDEALKPEDRARADSGDWTEGESVESRTFALWVAARNFMKETPAPSIGAVIEAACHDGAL